MHYSDYITNCIEIGAMKVFENREGKMIDYDVNFNAESILVDLETFKGFSQFSLEFINDKYRYNDDILLKYTAIGVLDEIICCLIGMKETPTDGMIPLFVISELEDLCKHISSNLLTKKFKPMKTIKEEFKEYFPWYE